MGKNEEEKELKWVICPICHNKTRLKLREDTVMQHFLLYCPKCRQENLINVRNFRVEVLNS